MTITIKPSDMIKTFIWDKYQHFCLDDKPNAEIAAIIAADEEFIINERDAFVIGLTNVLYTPEVLYKFKQFLLETLSNKNFDVEEIDNSGKPKVRSYINRQILIHSCNTFKNKIPKTWIPDDIVFEMELKALPDVYTTFIDGINNLISKEIQDWPCVKCAQVKKIINKLK